MKASGIFIVAVSTGKWFSGIPRYNHRKFNITVLLQAKRTPFGAFGGKLKGFSATDLGVHAAKAAIKEANVSDDF